jgi:hypothetical protein
VRFLVTVEADTDTNAERGEQRHERRGQQHPVGLQAEPHFTIDAGVANSTDTIFQVIQADEQRFTAVEHHLHRGQSVRSYMSADAASNLVDHFE